MSLINDALRRANQAKKQQPAQPSGDAPMRAVEPSPKTNTSLLPIVLIVLLAIGLGSAGWFFWMSSRVESKSIAATKMEINSSKAIPPVAKEKIPPSEISSNPVIAAPQEPATAPAPVPATEPVTTLAVDATLPPIVPPAPTAPVLKLQGIFYRTSNPTALISGKTVGIGETVSGARVLSITRQQVILERDNEKIVLDFDNR